MTDKIETDTKSIIETVHESTIETVSDPETDSNNSMRKIICIEAIEDPDHICQQKIWSGNSTIYCRQLFSPTCQTYFE
jgi:hypothetical protein